MRYRLVALTWSSVKEKAPTDCFLNPTSVTRHCFSVPPDFSSFKSIIFNPSFALLLFPFLSHWYRSAHSLNKNKSTELQSGKKLGKESGRSDWGRDVIVEESGRQAEDERMKATTEKSVFSGLVERWPSLRATWTTLSPQCSRYQSVLQSDLHHSSRLQNRDFVYLLNFCVDGRQKWLFSSLHFLHLSDSCNSQV